MGITIISLFVVCAIFLIIGRLTYSPCSDKEKNLPKIKDSNLRNSEFWYLLLIVEMVIFCVAALTFLFTGSQMIDAMKSGEIETEVVEVSENEIYALKDNKYIATRNSGGSVVYYYVIENVAGKGGQIKQYSASASYINPIPDNEQPYVKKSKIKIKNKSDYMFYFPITVTENYFYVPEKAIIDDYEINLE